MVYEVDEVESDYVFVNLWKGEKGRPMTYAGALSLFRHLSKRSGVPVHPHILRHTFCSHLAMRGTPGRAIQELAVHGELTVTKQDMHLSRGALDSAIRLLESPPCSLCAGIAKAPCRPETKHPRRSAASFARIGICRQYGRVQSTPKRQCLPNPLSATRPCPSFFRAPPGFPFCRPEYRSVYRRRLGRIRRSPNRGPPFPQGLFAVRSSIPFLHWRL